MTDIAGTQPLADSARRGLDYKWVAALVCVLGLLMAVLDQTVVNVALPKLESDFNTTLSTIQWIVTGYSLSLAAIIPLSAWLSDRLGSKWVFIASEAMFVIGSMLCGVAQSADQIIIFRVLQGLGGGLLMPVGMTILMRATPPDERGRIMAVLGVPIMLGPVAGPLLGGWFVQSFTWRLIFFINVPVGIVAVLAAVVWLRPDRAADAPRYPLDVLGVLLVSPAVVGITYGLSQPAQHGWGSWQTLVPLIGGLIVLGLFVFWELSRRHPLLDLRVFRDSAYAAGQVLVFLIVAGLFGVVFLVPLFLQQIQGMGTLKSGFILAFQGIAMVFVMPVAGILTDRVGARVIVPFGIVLMTVSTLWLSTLSWDTSEGVLILMMLFRGVGFGFAMMPAFASAYVTLRPELVAGATSIMNVVQNVSGAIGVAILSTILTNRISAAMPAIPGHSIGGSTADLASLNLPPQLKDVLLQQAAKGFDATFVIAAGIGVLCLPASLLLQKAFTAEQIRDHAMGQMRQGILFARAAVLLRQAGHLAGDATADLLHAALRSAARRRVDRGATLLRLGAEGGGLLPRPPLSPALRVAVGLTAVLGVACAILGFVHGFQKPDVPDIAPLLQQLQAPPGH